MVKIGAKSAAAKPVKKAGKAIHKEGGKQPPNGVYLNFFTYYHNYLKMQHPRWSTNQISLIISLLWKKRKLTNKKSTKVQKVQTTFIEGKQVPLPKRPKSAFFLFSEEERQKVMEMKGNSMQLMKLIGKKWKQLSPAERQKYDNKAKLLKEEYEKGKQEFIEKFDFFPQTQPVTKNQSVKQPKKAANAHNPLMSLLHTVHGSQFQNPLRNVLGSIASPPA